MDRAETQKAEMDKLLSAAEAYCEEYNVQHLSLCVIIDDEEIYGRIDNRESGGEIYRFKKRAQERQLQTGA